MLSLNQSTIIQYGAFIYLLQTFVGQVVVLWVSVEFIQSPITPEPPRVTIGLSNLNVRPVDAMRFKASDYVTFAEDGGYDREAGFEFTPLRFPSTQLATEELAYEGHVPVMHESWQEARLRDFSLRSGVRDLIGQVSLTCAFPLLDKSYGRLGLIQEAAQRGMQTRGEILHNVPIIVHPAGQYLDNQAPRRPRQSFAPDRFGGSLFQPTAEWAKSQGVNVGSIHSQAVASEIAEAMQAQRLNGMALDLHHLQTIRAGSRFRDPIGLAGALAAQSTLHEVQLSLRPEFDGDEAETLKVCQGQLAKTTFGRMLEAINATTSTRPIRLIIEVQAAVIKRLVNDKPLQEVHRIITDSVRTHMNT